ncbi:MAG: (2Fe-2S)-binding protein [Candidatus Bathyarchaeia archaeon]
MKEIAINITVNGMRHQVLVKPHWTLASLLRDILNLTSVKVACGTGDCGCCTVIANGKAILSCLTPAARADGMEIETNEGLRKEGHLHPIQTSLVQHGAVQCGFCIPGMVMNLKAYLAENPNSSEEELRKVLGGNICRCTGYVKQVEALLKARDELMSEKRLS